MGENNVSIIPDVVKSASEAIHTNIPETAKQTDEALSTVVGFFNNVVLYPVKKANITFRYKLEAFETDLKSKIKDIPAKNLQTPPTIIAGPTLEALRYTYDEEELREMYENLLASAMDSRKSSLVHPAFVDTIRQMSPLDAQILEKIVEVSQLRCAEISFVLSKTKELYEIAMPKYFVVELFDLGDPFAISASITNLSRLGLILVMLEKRIVNADYESIKLHPYVQMREKQFRLLGDNFKTRLTAHTIMTNDYCKQFAKICLAKEIG